jgi:hypothetical protein
MGYPNDVILTKLPLKRSCLQIHSHAEVLEVKASIYEFVDDTIQHIASKSLTINILKICYSRQISILSIFFFLVVLGFEFRALSLLGRSSST